MRLARKALLFMQSTRKDLLEVLVLLNALHSQWRSEYDADGQKLPPSEFYNMEVGENLQMGQEYVLWQQFEVIFTPLCPYISPVLTIPCFTFFLISESKHMQEHNCLLGLPRMKLQIVQDYFSQEASETCGDRLSCSLWM